MEKTKEKYRKPLITASIAALLMGMLLFIVNTFEDVIGHGIAIASFAATAAIVAMQPTARVSRPKTILISYSTTATIGFLVSFLPLNTTIITAIGVGLGVAILMTLDRMHPPAIPYILSFTISGYGLAELIFTFPALAAFFVALGIVVFVVEQVALFLGVLKKSEKESPKTTYEKTEHLVDQLVPYALVVLFVSLFAEFTYTEELAPYRLYFIFIDWAVIALFVTDLTLKFRKTKHVENFIKNYWLDIIATIPFFVFFRVFQGVAIGFEMVARGTIEIGRDATALTRFLRPIARFPRFARLIERVEILADTPPHTQTFNNN